MGVQLTSVAPVEDFGLPPGVNLRALPPNMDGRGVLTEVYRASWPLGFQLSQLNVVKSRAGVLRGGHLHLRHDEFYVPVTGLMLIGLFDLRQQPARPGMLLTLSGDAPQLLTIPCGVVHSCYSVTDTVMLAAPSEEYDVEDDLGCRWDDPDLLTAWPDIAPQISDRDASAGSLAGLRAAFDRNARP
jgi:dTDP-4-dehydrorhamnose 3,5-epimerase